MKKNEKVLAISPEINATILHTPACTQTWWTEAMGWPIGVRKMRKMCKNGKNWEIGQKIMKKNEKVFNISPEINATILHTPVCTQTWWTEAMEWPIGVRKMRKMCKNSKNWEIWQKIMKKKWKSSQYLTWNQCNYTSHTCLYPKMMNRGHGVAHRGAQIVQKWQKLGKWA